MPVPRGAGPDQALLDRIRAESVHGTRHGSGVPRSVSHVPVTLLRAAPGKPWLRIEGFVTPDELLQLYRQ